ncbi:YihY/virulence factor BrkB family protein [Sphingomonas gei]|nr:YihY/virulence factor BrkB family protein [Sphingomonas gei]
MSWAAWRAVALRTVKESASDNIGLAAAGVAFYGFLALVPLLSAIVLSYGIFAEPDTVVRHMRALTAVMPADVATSVGEQLMTVVEGSDGGKGFGVLLAVALALFGARNGAGALVSALNIAYDEDEKRGFVRLNLIALAITAAGALAAMLAALAVAALAAVGTLLPYANDALLILGTILSYVLLTLAGAAGAAALFRFAPSRTGARWRWITPGSILAGLLWLGLTLGFGAYVAHIAHFNATYGSLGAVIALLTWLYLSSYALLFGGELNSELERQSKCETEPPADIRSPEAVAPAARAMPLSANATESPGDQSFIAARVAARAARGAGLPKVGWITSGMATLGLTMLRREGRSGLGLALVAAAAGITWMRRRI